MRIVVYMLFYLERLVLALHIDADENVQRFRTLGSLFVVLAVYGKLGVVCILHPTSFIILIQVFVYASVQEGFVKFLHQIELAGEVHHRTGLALLVDHKQ